MILSSCQRNELVQSHGISFLEKRQENIIVNNSNRNDVRKKLKENNVVKISNFGNFKVLNKKERVGRNPKNKVETKISARKVVTFKSSNFFKNKINE